MSNKQESAAATAGASSSSAETAPTINNSNATLSGAGSGELTEEQLRNLRGQIHHSLLRHDVYGQVRQILSQNCIDPSSGSFQSPTSPSDVLEVLRQRGVVQQIASSIASGSRASPFSSKNTQQQSQQQPSSSLLQMNRVSTVDIRSALHTKGAQRLLLIRLLGGRAFVDNMNPEVGTTTTTASNNTNETRHSMVVHVHFGTHRFRSQPRPADVDPEFDDEFLAEINPGAAKELSELSEFPLRVCVTKESPFMAKSVFVGENTVDWRRVLRTGSLSVAVELSGGASQSSSCGVPAGLLELQLELMPDVRVHSDEELQIRAEQEKNAVVAADREMLLYARRWWSEFHALSPKFAQRKVKVFAHSSSTGRTLPVTHFIHRIAPDRSIDGPEEAARFVSLFGQEHVDARGAELVINNKNSGSSTNLESGAWCDMLRFVTTRRGDGASHATLLCSLFLGQGLDAYCVIGTDSSSSNNNNNATSVAVITRKFVGGNSNNQNDNSFIATLWNPIDATHRDINASVETNVNHQPFCISTIGCVFNATDYFANIQMEDSLFQCDFDLDNESKWVRMNPVKLHVVPRPPSVPPLWIPLDARGIEFDFEQRLQRVIADHRSRILSLNNTNDDNSNGNSNNITVFDTQLAACFSQALSRSELRRRGVLDSGANNNDFFEQCIRGFVEGHTFKGLPLCMPHVDANKVLQAALQVPVGRSVIECGFEGAKLAVRSKVFLFPEGILACWVMIGVKYRTL